MYSQLRQVTDPAKDSSKYATSEFVKAGKANIPVNRGLARDLDNNDGFGEYLNPAIDQADSPGCVSCGWFIDNFALGSFREAPFQTRGWQDMEEMRRLNNENETWEAVLPFEESRLYKEVMESYRSWQRAQTQRLRTSHCHHSHLATRR